MNYLPQNGVVLFFMSGKILWEEKAIGREEIKKKVNYCKSGIPRRISPKLQFIDLNHVKAFETFSKLVLK